VDEGYCWCYNCDCECLFIKGKCCEKDICIDCGSVLIKSENDGYIPIEERPPPPEEGE